MSTSRPSVKSKCAAKPPRPRPPASKSQPNLSNLQSDFHSQPTSVYLHQNLRSKSQRVHRRETQQPNHNASTRDSSNCREFSFLLLMLFIIWGFIALHLQSSLNPPQKGFPDSTPRETWKSLMLRSRVSLLRTSSNPPDFIGDEPEAKKNGTASRVYPPHLELNTLRLQGLEANGRNESIGDTTKVSKLRGNHWMHNTSTKLLDPPTHFQSTEYDGSFLGKWAGPFDDIQDDALQRHPIFHDFTKRNEKQCRVNSFWNIIKGKSVMLVMHEASLTGAPLAVAELAEEMMKCSVNVLAVVLNKRGGLIPVLKQRGIPLLDDKRLKSWKRGAASDLIIAGSAACSSWIDGLVLRYPYASRHLVWWIMENRREYYDLSKHLLSSSAALVFLSRSQSSIWQNWSRSDGIYLTNIHSVISLSVSAKIAQISGVDTSVRQNSEIANTALQIRNEMRIQARERLGMHPDDVLILMLSSVNPGKGQVFVMQAVLNLVSELKIKNERLQHKSEAGEGLHMLHLDKHDDADNGNNNSRNDDSYDSSNNHKISSNNNNNNNIQNKYGSGFDYRKGNLNIVNDYNKLKVKLLIGSMNSKSNKAEYLGRLQNLLRHYEEISESIIWVNATLKVSPLYCAADVYAMNAQGLGETFGRVTVEAMAFGLPVMGTNAGGTMEIVEDQRMGFLHPVGKNGVIPLVHTLHLLLQNSTRRREAGLRGRQKVVEHYLDVPMYDKLCQVFLDVMRTNSFSNTSL